MLSMSSVKGHRNPAVEYYVCGRYSTAACKDAIWEGQGFELQANVRVQKALVRRPQGHIWTTIHPQVLLLLILSTNIEAQILLVIFGTLSHLFTLQGYHSI
jgi:hypothetical protein